MPEDFDPIIDVTPVDSQATRLNPDDVQAEYVRRAQAQAQPQSNQMPRSGAKSALSGIVLAIVGVLLVLIGVPMLILPGPGLLTIIIGVVLIAVGIGRLRGKKSR